MGRQPAELARRLESNPKLPLASTFIDETRAERLVAEALARRGAAIEEWLAGTAPKTRLDEVMDVPTGLCLSRAEGLFEGTSLRVVLARDPSMPDGYRVLTAFPQP